MCAKRLDESEHARILGRDAVGDGSRDADDLLEHFEKGVGFVLAGADLAGFHAEGAFEVHPLLSAVKGFFSDFVCTSCVFEWAVVYKREWERERDRERVEDGRSFTYKVWWICAA